MNAPAPIFGSPEGEPNVTTNRPTIQQMCEKVWTLPRPASPIRSREERTSGLRGDPG
jgi:hypothetical protein